MKDKRFLNVDKSVVLRYDNIISFYHHHSNVSQLVIEIWYAIYCPFLLYPPAFGHSLPLPHSLSHFSTTLTLTLTLTLFCHTREGRRKRGARNRRGGSRRGKHHGSNHHSIIIPFQSLSYVFICDQTRVKWSPWNAMLNSIITYAQVISEKSRPVLVLACRKWGGRWGGLRWQPTTLMTTLTSLPINHCSGCRSSSFSFSPLRHSNLIW